MIKLLAIALLTILSTQNLAALTAEEKKQGKDFDKGETYQECMENCRDHHRNELKWPRGHARGLCWDVCTQEHSESKTIKKTKKYKKNKN